MSRDHRPSRATASGVRGVSFATSPLLASRTPPWRSRFVLLLVGAAFALLLGRAVWVQLVATEFYQAQGDKRFVYKQALPASRGRVLDRNGLVLATSVALPSVQADLRSFQADAAQRRQLARLLGFKPGELADRLEGSGTVTLRRHVEEDVWQQVRALGVKGVYEVREYKRRYPEGEASAQVVGLTNADERGLEGVELAFDDQLQGRRGQRTVLRDRLGRAVEHVGDQRAPENGRDVTLSLDSKVQFFAWQRLRDAVQTHGANSGSAVVMDVRTGEVLALANYPSFDPSRPRRAEDQRVRNRALTDVFEPGSTMKPFIAALAMESGRARASTLVDTGEGRIVITGRPIHDTKPHGVLSVAQVVQKSSNVGTVKLAMAMPAQEIWELYSAVGLGQKPRIEFPGAVTGRLRPHKSWRPVEQATMSYGYGLSASLLQLAGAYTVFARDGQLIAPTLLHTGTPATGTPVLSPEVARQLRTMLQDAAGPGGTGPKAQTVGYSVGGKSGTARKLEGGQYTNKYRAWFVGLAPVSDPRIVVAVMVDEPRRGGYYGGDVAAPVFSQVVQQTLRLMNVAPDLDVQPHIVARTVPAVTESF